MGDGGEDLVRDAEHNPARARAKQLAVAVSVHRAVNNAQHGAAISKPIRIADSRCHQPSVSAPGAG
jgi:hypothetical protein